MHELFLSAAISARTMHEAQTLGLKKEPNRGPRLNITTTSFVALYSGPSGLQILLLLFNLIHDRECIPQGWREGKLVSVPKSGDLTNCANYRGLTLLPAISKLFSNLLLQRASPHVELSDHQYGFRHGRGTADALFALDATVRPRVQRGELTYLFFLDWSKAYDRVMHHAFLARLAHKGVTGKLWRHIDALYQHCSAQACTDGCHSTPLAVHCGVAQGCPLSPFLYAAFIDGLLDSVHSECADSGLLAGSSPLVLQAYADDKVAASSSPRGLQRILHAMKRYGDTWGCCANTDKSRVLLVGPPGAVAEARNHGFRWGSAPLQVVDQVKYLGVRLNCAWTWDTHIAAA
jgi:hypothetical protein